MVYKDKTFCMSEKCKNECGRQWSEPERSRYNELSKLNSFVIPVSFADFCDENGRLKEQK